MKNLEKAFKVPKFAIKSAISAFLLLLSVFFLISFGLNKREKIVEKISIFNEFEKKERQETKKIEKKLKNAPLSISESKKNLEKLEMQVDTLYPQFVDMNYLSEGALKASQGDGFLEEERVSMQIFEVVQLDKTPKRLKNARIQYPSEMLKRDIQGEVRLLVLIDEEGNLTLEKVLFATNEYFEKAAILALKEFKYEAPLKMGKKVKARFILPIPFNIERIK